MSTGTLLGVLPEHFIPPFIKANCPLVVGKEIGGGKMKPEGWKELEGRVLTGCGLSDRFYKHRQPPPPAPAFEGYAPCTYSPRC